MAQVDPSLFPAFQPLLEKLGPYGQLSGARFRGRSFDELPEAFEVVGGQQDAALAQRLNAKLESVEDVNIFTARLRAKDPALMEEFYRASRLVMQESVRQAVMATLKELGLWPAEGTEVDREDIGWEDMSTNIHQVTTRCYNYEMLTSSDPRYQNLKALYTTGSFLVDFAAHALKDTAPKVLEQDSTSQLVMRDFIELVKRYEQSMKLPEARMLQVQNAFIDGLTEHGRWPERWVRANDVREWFDDNMFTAVAGGFAIAALVGAAFLFSKGKR
eukprot:GEMP01045270.1.p1 GENE.GEMP01045270.1~~GEMP01045270.1.p1  ORF type:complete len:273 (+),score=65.21 GEMP01045270.1:92-910(+)